MYQSSQSNTDFFLNKPYRALAASLVVTVVSFLAAFVLTVNAEGSIERPGLARTDPGTSLKKESLASYAHKVALELRENGQMITPVHVTGHDLPNSNGSATWDVAKGVCNVKIRHAALADVGAALEDPLWGRFLALHELAHCDLFVEPGGLLPAANSLGWAKRSMVDDFFALHAIKVDPASFEESRPDALIVLHEAYADTMALLRLRKEGHSASALAFVRQLRQEGSFDVAHDTVGVIDEAMAIPLSKLTDMSIQEMMTASKTIALRHYISTVTQASRAGDGFSVLLGPRLMSTLQMVHKSMVKNKIELHPYFEGAKQASPFAMKAYPAFKSLELASISSPNKNDYKSFSNAWIKSSYGLSRSDFLEKADALSKSMEINAMAQRQASSSGSLARER